jgi:hypothetical protein
MRSTARRPPSRRSRVLGVVPSRAVPRAGRSRRKNGRTLCDPRSKISVNGGRRVQNPISASDALAASCGCSASATDGSRRVAASGAICRSCQPRRSLPKTPSSYALPFGSRVVAGTNAPNQTMRAPCRRSKHRRRARRLLQLPAQPLPRRAARLRPAQRTTLRAPNQDIETCLSFAETSSWRRGSRAEPGSDRGGGWRRVEHVQPDRDGASLAKLADGAADRTGARREHGRARSSRRRRVELAFRPSGEYDQQHIKVGPRRS